MTYYQRIHVQNIVAGEKEGSPGVSSPDGQEGKSTSQQQQQQQQGDVETFRQSYLSPGKFDFNLGLIHFLDIYTLQLPTY